MKVQERITALAQAIGLDVKALFANKQNNLVSGTSIKTINGETLLGAGNVIVAGTANRTVLTLATAFSSTVVARANVTGMSFAITAGKKYMIDLVGTYQTASTTTGGSIGFVLPSGTGNIAGFITMAISQAPVATDLTATIRAINNNNATAGSFMTSTGVSLINSPHYFKAEMILDCLTTGVFQLQWASEVAGSAAQMNAGAVMVVEVLN